MRGRRVKTGLSVKKNVMTERAGEEEGKGHLVSVGRAVAFPIGSAVKNPLAIQVCRRPGFDPWVRKIPWRRAWQPTSVFLPGKSHGWRSLVGRVGHD